MAKKKSAASSYNSTLVNIQKLANNSAVAIQRMINKSNTEQAAFNSAEAQKSREWQEQMSKSAHQMEVEDLKKAGLNPVLSTGGAGAQSYTTSSASTQNDSGASSTAAILSGELGAMSSMESARMSAEAQKKAATLTAKATRYAAQQSAAAQMYNADMGYKLGKYKADLGYKSQQEERANQRYIMRNQNATTMAAFLDKHLRNTGLSPKIIKVWKDTLFKHKTSLGSSLMNGKVKIDSKNGHKNEFGEYVPNKGTQIYTRMNTALLRMGIEPNDDTRGLLWRATKKRDGKALKYLATFITRNGNTIRPGYR